MLITHLLTIDVWGGHEVWIHIVCDGHGGQHIGRRVPAILGDALLAFLKPLIDAWDGISSPGFLQEAVRSGFAAVTKTLKAESDHMTHKQSGSTCNALVRVDGWCMMAWVGDTVGLVNESQSQVCSAGREAVRSDSRHNIWIRQGRRDRPGDSAGLGSWRPRVYPESILRELSPVHRCAATVATRKAALPDRSVSPHLRVRDVRPYCTDEMPRLGAFSGHENSRIWPPGKAHPRAQRAL